MSELLRTLIPLVSSDRRAYYLKPPDINASNVFIDAEFNISCVIDWTSSLTVPLSTLLMTPSFPNQRDSVEPALVPVFRDSIVVNSSQKQKDLLSKFQWESTDESWLFWQLITLDGIQDYHQFIKLYMRVYPKFNELETRRCFNRLRQDPAFIERASVFIANESSYQDGENEEEREYFAHRGSAAEALARELTKKAVLDQNFIADTEFWLRIASNIGPD